MEGHATIAWHAMIDHNNNNNDSLICSPCEMVIEDCGGGRGDKGRHTVRGGWLRGGCLSMWLSVGLSCDPKIESNLIVKAAVRLLNRASVCRMTKGRSKGRRPCIGFLSMWISNCKSCFFPFFDGGMSLLIMSDDYWIPIVLYCCPRAFRVSNSKEFGKNKKW